MIIHLMDVHDYDGAEKKGIIKSPHTYDTYGPTLMQRGLQCPHY